MHLDLDRGQQTIRVLVVDNTRIHAQLLADALKRDPSLEIIGAVSHSGDLIDLIHSQKVDVAVIGCNLDEQPLHGIEVLRQLKSTWGGIRAIILLDSSKRDVVIEAFRAGARGLFTRHESLEMLSKCVRRVHEGQIWANTEQIGFAIDALAAAPTVRAVGANGIDLLSKRELEVVRCLAEGMTNREIATRLGLSQHTIKNYLFRVFDKLGVSSRLELLSLTLTQSTPGAPLIDSSSVDTNPTSLAGCLNAAEQGVPSAQLALAWMYWQGKGVAADPVSAYMWYLVSERSSSDMKEEIVTAKRKLSEVMSTEQVIEAQKRAAARFRQGKPVSTHAATASASSAVRLNY
ncbi:MAG TPA: LuxR C-terminal-related transcriptional regulator [Terriglobales bacterium]|jgi:DNA-binding NarL/FixJ family response regulator